MQKKSLLIVYLLLALTTLVSAAQYSVGISDFFNSVDQTELVLVVVIIISFGIFYFALSKFFKENTKIAAVISIALSALLGYFTLRYGYLDNISGIFYNVGLSEEILYPLTIIFIVALFILITIKMRGVGWGLIGVGAILLLVGIVGALTGFLAEVGVLMVIGGILFGFGLLAKLLGQRRSIN